MGTPHSPAPANAPDGINPHTLLQQLQASPSWTSTGLWRAYVCAALYAVVAAMQGRHFFALYCGVLVVAFLLHAASEQRTRRQMELLAQLLGELSRKGA